MKLNMTHQELALWLPMQQQQGYTHLQSQD
jgi:hypothetical protein